MITRPWWIRFNPKTEAERLHSELPHVLGKEPPFDILALCKHYHIEAFAYPFPQSLDGCLINDGGYFAIGVNSRHPRARRRFSAAHEFYHYLNHRWKMPDTSCMTSPGTNNVDELEASAFAAELLMPEYLITRAWFGHKQARVIAPLFGVSVLAVANRLEELRIVRRRR